MKSIFEWSDQEFGNDIERLLYYKGSLTYEDVDKILIKNKLATHKTLHEYYREKFIELKQQLAEKEKEIEKLQHYNDRLAQGIYHSYGEHFVSKIKQDKISFALEQLEKVKDYLIQKLVSITKLLDPLLDPFKCENYHEFIDLSSCYRDSIEQIDNQIEELTHQHEDKGGIK